MYSDNSPAFDQARIQFPFSLGARLGRGYTWTQMASTFRESGQRKYFIARRVEYQVSRRLNADVQEAVKSNSSGTLWLTPVPFGTGSANFSSLLPGVHVTSNDQASNYVVNLGLTYSAPPSARVYGQFLIDDLKSPFGGKHHDTQRKIGYLIGGAARPLPDTNVVLEYAYTDPTLYTHSDPVAQWQHGALDEIALPSGPNSIDVYARVDQKIDSRWSVTVDMRNRKRRDNSFPEPDSRHTEAIVTYLLSRHNWIGVGYHNFREDPFPFAPGSPNYPIPHDNTADQGNQGYHIRSQEWDFTYGMSF